MHLPITAVKRHDRRNFSSSSLPTRAPCRQSTAFAHFPIPHPLIHLPPLRSVSPSHNPPFAIITRSTSSLQLPWQQQCWAQIPMLPASATDQYHLLSQYKVTQSFSNDLWTTRGRIWGRHWTFFIDQLLFCSSFTNTTAYFVQYCKGKTDHCVLRRIGQVSLPKNTFTHCSYIK